MIVVKNLMSLVLIAKSKCKWPKKNGKTKIAKEHTWTFCKLRVRGEVKALRGAANERPFAMF